MIRGRVQGVGFRPFVVRLAKRLELAGFVSNDPRGVTIEIEGPADRVRAFVRMLPRELPPLASIGLMRSIRQAPQGDRAFLVRPSQLDGERQAEVAPDAATCPECLREVTDAADRRARYAFANCTNCGPRYSIIREIPYDRPATTMAGFRMCADCAREYADVADRRYHAEPIACPTCGPKLRLADGAGNGLAGDPIETASRMLAAGRVIAIKGIGGYHLACDAANASAVRRLRRGKLRDGKPLAVMVADLAVADRCCALDDLERATLCSTAAPIVLARRRPSGMVTGEVAPGCADLGVMLPYTPLHHLLMQTAPPVLVMTSGNRSGSPLTYRDDDAAAELGDIADGILLHDREIFRPIDDSVVHCAAGGVTPVRRARGYVPRPIVVTPPRRGDSTRVLAVGGELKSTFCLLQGGSALVSEHLGDLTNPDTYRHFVASIPRLAALYGFSPDVVAHDLHPAYESTRYAESLNLPALAVQHHHAHIASVMAEADEPGPLIGLVCDGTGWGTDGTVWGCELLRCERGEFSRLGHMDRFPLVGGDAASIETWRPAGALLAAAYGERWPDWLAAMLPRVAARFAQAAGGRAAPFEAQRRARLNTPMTSSLGRLFDAAACLLGLCDRNRHEAEAAMALEAAAASWGEAVEPWPMPVIRRRDGLLLLPAPLVAAICEGIEAGESADRLAAQFHETIAQALAQAALRAAETAGLSTVALSGGCFLNRILLTGVIARLEATGLRVLTNHEVPPGDGGVSLGQAYVAIWKLADTTSPTTGD